MRMKPMVLTAAAAALIAAPAAAQKINVGQLADYSGPTSDVGKPFGEGVADAMAWINKNGGVAKRQVNLDTVDYGYQVPRSIATYKKWTGRDKVVAIFGWGTADTEALITFVSKDQIPYISGSYAGSLTDPTGKAEKATAAAPFNFFYGPSYSDAARALVTWAAEDWKKKGGQGAPKYVHMGANHPYPNAPKAAAEALAKELGFEVLPAIQFALTPGDYTAQCLTLKQSGANYAYLGNTAGSNVSVLKACKNAGVQIQFMGNVWGMDENAAKAAGDAADGVVLPVRTRTLWSDDAPGMKTVREIGGTGSYRPSHYIAGICTAFYIKEAMEWAAGNGGITSIKIRDGMYARKNWVPKGMDGVCVPSTWSKTDHRPTTEVLLYRARISGATDAPLDELIKSGVVKMEKVTTVNLPRKPEWLGW